MDPVVSNIILELDHDYCWDLMTKSTKPNITPATDTAIIASFFLTLNNSLMPRLPIFLTLI